MEMLRAVSNFITLYPQILIILALWEMGFKAVGLWKAARNSQKYWFIAIMVVNSLGILPILYLRFFQKKAIVQPVQI